MVLVIDLRIKTLDVEIPLLQINFEVMAIENNSSAE